MMRRTSQLLALALAVGTTAASAQSNAWQRKWYWGGQGGMVFYTTPRMTGTQTAITGGGHWLITGKRSALYLAVNQIKYADSSITAVADQSAAATLGLRDVTFTSGHTIQAGIYIIPTDSKVQLLVGGGFAINEITDAQPVYTTLTPTAQEITAATLAVDDATTKAFLWVSGGLQMRFGRWALFGQYTFMPAAKDFAINAGIQDVTFGLRFALASAHEDVTTSEK
jgi:hypothetical protein